MVEVQEQPATEAIMVIREKRKLVGERLELLYNWLDAN